MQTRLDTKLHRPAVSDDFVIRPRLFEQLDRGLERKLTLVSAPAGFGKTSLVASWLQTRVRPAAWLSLDESDNNAIAFLDYVVAAIRSACPEACAQTQAMLAASQPPPLESMVNMLINEIGRAPRPFVLVLDDYHVIHDAAVHQAMSRLIRYQPGRLHLVVLTRSDPALPLSGLRARAAQLHEIRAHDLRFNADEIRDFLDKTVATRLDDTSLSVLAHKTEGWIAGLRLASLSMQGRERPEEFVAAFGGTHRYIMAYLLDEVLAHQPPHVVEFLLRTSILDRFCAELCDAVAAPDGTASALSGAEFLAWLTSINLFVVPLDDAETWYRYHHLFQDLLQHKLRERLDATNVAQLHLAASDWLVNHDFIDEGIHHALVADQPIQAAQIVEDHVLDVLHHEEWRRLKHWIDALPEEVIASRPQLLTAKAWSHYVLHLSDPNILLPLMAEAERLLPPSSSQAPRQVPGHSNTDPSTCADDETEQALRQRWIRGSVSIFTAEACLSRNDVAGATAQARQALRLLPGRYMVNRGTAVNLWAQAGVLAGQHDEVIAWISDELLRHEGRTEHAPYVVRLFGALCSMLLNLGDMKQLAIVAARMLRTCERSNALSSAGWAHLYSGYAHLEWNDLEAALNDFRSIVEHSHRLNHGLMRLALCGMAFTHQALGGSADATLAADALDRLDVEFYGHITPVTRSLRAHLALLQGNLDIAEQWLHALADGIEAPMYPIFMPEMPDLTRVKVLLAMGSEDSLRRAHTYLRALLALAETAHYTRVVIQLRALQAAAFERQGHRCEALDALNRAFVLARPSEFIRTFVDAGPTVAQLLEHASARQDAPAYIAKLQAAFAQTPTRATTDAATLTQRELEVLQCFDQRLSNKEIAQRLVITTQTVQRHATNIFDKLGVRGRRQAVLKARQLHILS
jgi:LuxR family maltose regulon positive regulatory protein